MKKIKRMVMKMNKMGVKKVKAADQTTVEAMVAVVGKIALKTHFSIMKRMRKKGITTKKMTTMVIIMTQKVIAMSLVVRKRKAEKKMRVKKKMEVTKIKKMTKMKINHLLLKQLQNQNRQRRKKRRKSLKRKRKSLKRLL